MPSLIFDIAKKGGPYVAIVVIGIYAYILHLKLATCDIQLSNATQANHAYEEKTKKQDKSITKAHDKEVKSTALMKTLQEKINAQTKKSNEKLKGFITDAPKNLDCIAGVQWTIRQSRGL